MSLQDIYESGRTVRYHANPQINVFRQPVADHTWGMIALLFDLHENPSLNLIQAITFHDSSERWIGDVPYPFKLEAPDRAHHHEMVGEVIALKKSIPCRVPLTNEEKTWLKLLDRLESHMFVKLHRPEELKAWASNTQAIYEAAEELGIEEKIEEIING